MVGSECEAAANMGRKDGEMSEEHAKSGKGGTASGYTGDKGSTAGPGPTKVVSTTPENEKGEINPSAPEDSNTTPGTTAQAIE